MISQIISLNNDSLLPGRLYTYMTLREGVSSTPLPDKFIAACFHPNLAAVKFTASSDTCAPWHRPRCERVPYRRQSTTLDEHSARLCAGVQFPLRLHLVLRFGKG